MDREPMDRRPEAYLAAGIAAAATFAAGFDAFTYKENGAAASLWEAIGPMTFFFTFLILPALYFLYYGQQYWRFRSEFHGLTTTRSKARFISNIDRIEYLAWKLGPDYGEIVEDRRDGFGIGRR